MKSKLTVTLITLSVIILVGFILYNNKQKIEAAKEQKFENVYTIKTEQVKSERVSETLNFIGKTEAVNDVELISETYGKIVKVFKDNGDNLRKGDLIAVVDNEVFEANYKLAEAAYKKAKTDYTRYETLIKEGNLSSSDFERAKVELQSAEAQYFIAKKSYNDSGIKSPVDGSIAKRYINIGATVSQGTPVANIVDISSLKINLSVPGEDIQKFNIGSRVSVKIKNADNITVEGKVKSIGMKADASDNFNVEITIANQGRKIKAGLFADVTYNINYNDAGMTIPREAIKGSFIDPAVYVIKEGTVEERKIETGLILKDRVVVKKGLSADDIIITRGQNNVEPGSKINIDNNK